MKRFFSFISLPFFFISILFFSGCALFQNKEVTPVIEDSFNTVKEDDTIQKEEEKIQDEITPQAFEAPKEGIKEDIQEITVIAKRWEFNPSVITVKKGKKARLNISSLDVPHSFVLSVFNINEFLAPGQTKVVEFTPEEIGTFNFSCSVYCGDGHSGMKGILVVEE